MADSPAPAAPVVWPLLASRALRAFADGYVAVLLPAYLLALGFGTRAVGFLASTTLLGSALTTLAVGTWGHRISQRLLLSAAALLMLATGLSFAATTHFWPLLLIALIGTLNPSSGDVSVFLPLEHAQLARLAPEQQRTAWFARYSLIGVLFAALGALAVALPDALAARFAWSRLDALRAMFVIYGLVGASVWLLYRHLPRLAPDPAHTPTPLGPSRRTVARLALLFSVDSFAGGLAINALLALWLFRRFEVPLAVAGLFFFWTGLCSAASQLLAPPLARRIGLVPTMVFTHIPASLCLIAAAFAPTLPLAYGLLIARSLFSQMDVPARAALVMAAVTPAERAAAASYTAVPRSLSAAFGPALGGALLAAGWLPAPLLLCGLLKIAYDLALWRLFGRAH